jgi:hypothetical protein
LGQGTLGFGDLGSLFLHRFRPTDIVAHVDDSKINACASDSHGQEDKEKDDFKGR